MRKVLIITYYWPPAGGGGVQRWLKFAKYLPQFGWEPIIFAPDGADYPLIDPSLEKDVPAGLTVIKRPIKEPRKFVKSTTERSGDKPSTTDQLFYVPRAERSWKQNLVIWIRGNLFIPDARAWWIKPSVKYLRSLIEEEQIDTIVTTGPPHSLHLIGLHLSNNIADLRWLADFRDPWTQIEYYDKLMLTGFADRMHRRLEKSVLQQADTVVTVSPSWTRMLGDIGERNVHCITNGFDHADFAGARPGLDPQTTLCHVGTLARDRDPKALWKALEAINRKKPEQIHLKFLGSTDPAILENLGHDTLPYHDLGYTAHEQAIREMQKSHYLLLLINPDVAENAKGRVPGKVFEYLAAQRPILGICPPGSDVSRILGAHGHVVLDPDTIDDHTLQAAFTRLEDWKPDEEAIKAFTREHLTKQMANFLNIMHTGSSEPSMA